MENLGKLEQCIASNEKETSHTRIFHLSSSPRWDDVAGLEVMILLGGGKPTTSHGWVQRSHSMSCHNGICRVMSYYWMVDSHIF